MWVSQLIKSKASTITYQSQTSFQNIKYCNHNTTLHGKTDMLINDKLENVTALIRQHEIRK